MSRTLSEVYAGMLSRDWDTLLKIIEGGGNRVLICQETSRRSGFGQYVADVSEVSGWRGADSTLDALEMICIGWLPAPGDNPIDIIKSQYHGYMEG